MKFFGPSGMWSGAKPPLPPRWGWPSAAVCWQEISSPLYPRQTFICSNMYCMTGMMGKASASWKTAGVRCGRAVGVIVIEMLLGEIGEPGPAPFMDLNMMVMLTGRERTLSEYRTLLKQGGFRLDKSSPIRSSLAVIEAVAA